MNTSHFYSPEFIDPFAWRRDFRSSEIKAVPALRIQSQSDEVIPYEHAKGESTEFKMLYGSYDIAQRFKTNGGCYDLYFVKDARHGHGFSQAYVTNAITLFVNYVLAGNCKKTTTENIKAITSNSLETINLNHDFSR